MSEKNYGILKGHFLMAMPGLPDPNFAQTVTCICEHNETGALGFIINRVHPLLTGLELFEDLKIKSSRSIEKFNIYLGGPVQPSGVFLLHGPPFDWYGCMQINSWLGLSNTRDILEAVALQEGPEDFLILLGCAGWGPLQLDNEINDSAWLTTPVVREILFETDVNLKWEKTMMQIGTVSDNPSDDSGKV
ncbi:MAG: YqgE/AlgH family protein [Desulfobacterium sp.]|jgi:putative transcriptional regulator|nr:YqgE/AlgH family protein [Desulfobacterium sp.]